MASALSLKDFVILSEGEHREPESKNPFVNKSVAVKEFFDSPNASPG